jgi:hypothetical protein
MGQVLPGDRLVHTSKGDYWASVYNFAQCNCTDYVAFKMNEGLERHSSTKPLFTNTFHSWNDFQWGNAFHWRDAIGKAVPGYFSRYPETLSTSALMYPWKITSDGVMYDVRRAVAWWDKNPNDANSVGHVAWLESVAGDGKTVTISEYNWSSVRGYGTRTLSPDQRGYPDGFLKWTNIISPNRVRSDHATVGFDHAEAVATYPINFSPGTYPIRVRADIYNAAQESNLV